VNALKSVDLRDIIGVRIKLNLQEEVKKCRCHMALNVFGLIDGMQASRGL